MPTPFLPVRGLFFNLFRDIHNFLIDSHVSFVIV
jgi:hypothetical protein